MFNIYVGNLPYTISQEDLEALFAQHGSVTRTNIVTDRETGRARGFAFVEMATEDEGRKAIDSLNGKEFSGRALTVNEARPREARGNSNGPRGGGGGGRFQRRSFGNDQGFGD